MYHMEKAWDSMHHMDRDMHRTKAAKVKKEKAKRAKEMQHATIVNTQGTLHDIVKT